MSLIQSTAPRSTLLVEMWQRKRFLKKKVVDYWEQKLREEASLLPSLIFFKPAFMSLSSPHPIWTTAGFSPFKVSMATTQALMLSGHYRCGSLVRHWSQKEDGHCSLSVECFDSLEDIPHILQYCPALSSIRKQLYEYTLNFSFNLPTDARDVILSCCDSSSPNYCLFLLDCSCLPDVIRLRQKYGSDILHKIFELTRTWVFLIHRERLKRLGRWVRTSTWYYSEEEDDQ